MFNSYGRVIATCLFLSLAGCQSTSQNTVPTSSHLGQLIIGEPLAVNFKNEVRLARISDLIHSDELKPQHLSQAFFERGVLYDSFGLTNLARIDFNRALRKNPKMADAYNFLGIHLTMAGQFDKAYEAFDATLELNPEHQYVYLNRGISLHYGGHKKLAVEDLTTFHQFEPSDPYRAIWLFIAEHRIDQAKALANLTLNLQSIDDSLWAKKIGDLFAMRISEAQFVKSLAVGISKNKAMAERLCEAYFYLGIYTRMYDQNERAINYFKLSLATNVFEFVEHRYARRELLETRLQLHRQSQLDKAAIDQAVSKDK